jgi:acyl-coenzyme A synthetase/AMP-(fatty) acid ligase
MTAALLDQGVAPGQRIALLMPRSIRLVAAMLAAQQCGAVFTLLPLTLAAERARDILDASEAVLVCHTAEALRHPALQGRRALNLGTVSPPAPDALAALRASGRIVAPGADADLCLFFTSGSQGRPKGVRLSHANWINRLEGDWHALPYAEGEACISKALTGFIDAFCEIFQPLLKKVPVYILPEGEEADVEALAEHLGHWKITRAMLVVSLMQGLLDVLRARGGRLGALRHIMSSGERLPAGVVGAFSRLLPHCTLHNYYGSTEVAADVVRCAVAPPGGEHDRRVVPLGGPMANMRIEIMSPARTPLPHGMPGEIAIAGPSVSPGYLAPETSGFFEHDGVRFFAPGDLGMWTENGELLGFGRRDRQIKIRGQRVEPGDIEQIMLRHPQIAQAAAFSLGDGADMTLAACVVLREPGAIPTDTLRRDFRRSLSGAMMPSLLLEVPALPRTATGKVDFIALRKTILQQAQEPTAPEAAPQTATEEAMAALWRRLLGHPIPHRQSDFFACGGHSLLAIRLIAAIRERFHAPLRAKDIFRYARFRGPLRTRGPARGAQRPADVGHHRNNGGAVTMTLLQLLKACKDRNIILAADAGKLIVTAPEGGMDPQLRDALKAAKADLLPLVAAGATEREPAAEEADTPRGTPRAPMPLSPYQLPFWASHSDDGPGKAMPTIAEAFDFEARLEPQTLQQALDWTVTRHDMLRATFTPDASGCCATPSIPGRPSAWKPAPPKAPGTPGPCATCWREPLPRPTTQNAIPRYGRGW